MENLLRIKRVKLRKGDRFVSVHLDPDRGDEQAHGQMVEVIDEMGTLRCTGGARSTKNGIKPCPDEDDTTSEVVTTPALPDIYWRTQPPAKLTKSEAEYITVIHGLHNPMVRDKSRDTDEIAALEKELG